MVSTRLQLTLPAVYRALVVRVRLCHTDYYQPQEKSVLKF